MIIKCNKIDVFRVLLLSFVKTMIKYESKDHGKDHESILYSYRYRLYNYKIYYIIQNFLDL